MTTTNYKPEKHIKQVDYIRAIASAAVALYHLGGKALPILNLGWLGVQMFFLLSGFIICWAIPKEYTWNMMGAFIGKRITRIEPPYVISIGLAIIVNFLCVAHYKPDWLNILCHFAYINNFTGQPYLSPVYWTLGIEFEFYLFIAICFPLILTKQGIWFIAVLCLIPIWISIPGDTLLGVFDFFALGIVYYLYLTGVKSLNESLIWGVLITGICVYQQGLINTIAALAALTLLVLPIKSNPVISFLSKISFSLYLTHDIIGSNLVVFMGTKMPHTLPFKALSFSTGIVVSLSFAYLFHKAVEAPFFRLSKHMRYTK